MSKQFEEWYDGYMYWHDEDEVDPEYLVRIAQRAWEAGAKSVVNSKLTPDHIANVRKMIPEDYVLVPVEPTEKMIEAGDVLWDHHCTSIYKAMIQAAQEKSDDL